MWYRLAILILAVTAVGMSFSKILARFRTISFDRYVAASLIVLMATTYRLWFWRDSTCPVIGTSLLPLSVPPVVLTTISILLLATAGAVLVTGERHGLASDSMGRSRRWLWVFASLLLAALFAFDQAHLQPWAYLTFIYAVLFAADGRRCSCLLRWVAVSVYLWSGLGKLDFQFVHTIGQDFLSALTWGATDSLNESTRTQLAMLLPIAEILIALGISIEAARRIVVRLLMIFHLTLIAILGPWALDHSLGVLVWNIVLIGQAYLLFGIQGQRALSEPSPGPSIRRSGWFSYVVTAIVIMGPMLERSERWDHWLAWSLYAPHTSRTEIEIAVSSAEKLPASIQEFLDDDPDLDQWRKLDLGQWSLQRRGVPIYPQGRYQLGWIQKFLAGTKIDDGVRVRVRGIADRVTGKRTERWLMGRTEILAR